MERYLPCIMILCGMMVSQSACAASVTIPLYEVAKQGRGKKIGDVVATDTKHGVLFESHLEGLGAGNYGFHMHQYPHCNDNGHAAGGHFDPMKTHQHLGPYSAKGHLGDLPTLVVDKMSGALLPVLAPRLTVAKLKGHSLVVHQGGDNYSDQPKALGGGDKRLFCGIIAL